MLLENVKVRHDDERQASAQYSTACVMTVRGSTLPEGVSGPRPFPRPPWPRGCKAHLDVSFLLRCIRSPPQYVLWFSGRGRREGEIKSRIKVARRAARGKRQGSDCQDPRLQEPQKSRDGRKAGGLPSSREDLGIGARGPNAAVWHKRGSRG